MTEVDFSFSAASILANNSDLDGDELIVFSFGHSGTLIIVQNIGRCQMIRLSHSSE